MLASNTCDRIHIVERCQGWKSFAPTLPPFLALLFLPFLFQISSELLRFGSWACWASSISLPSLAFLVTTSRVHIISCLHCILALFLSDRLYFELRWIVSFAPWLVPSRLLASSWEARCPINSWPPRRPTSRPLPPAEWKFPTRKHARNHGASWDP